MKAKDYFAKYEPILVNGGGTEEIYQLLMELNEETKSLIEARHCRTNSACAAVIREMNGKWNAINTLFEKKYGGLSPIKRNGFKNFWIREMPELASYFH